MRTNGLKLSAPERLGLLLCVLACGIVAAPERSLAGAGGKLFCSSDSICSSDQSCTFNGIKNVALGKATLSLNDSCHLVVSNIGASGEDGFSQVSLPAQTREIVTEFACPNFAESNAGAKEVVTVHADVPGGVFYTKTVENIGKNTLEIRPDFSPVGATLYTLTILNGDTVTAVFKDLPSANFRMAQGDQEEVN